MGGGRDDRDASLTVDDGDSLIQLLGDVLDRAVELVASPNGRMYEALERLEAACAQLRVWLRRRGTH